MTFERALWVFADPLALTVPDRQFADRWVTIGEAEGDLLVVVHIDVEGARDEEGCVIRIISARRATKREAQAYRG